MSNKRFQSLRDLGWRRGLLLLALIVVLWFTGVHALRLVRHVGPGPYKSDEEIRDWMSIGYIAHSYHVPPQILQQALGLPESPMDKRPLKQIANAQNRSLEDLTTTLEETIRQVRSSPPKDQP